MRFLELYCPQVSGKKVARFVARCLEKVAEGLWKVVTFNDTGVKLATLYTRQPCAAHNHASVLKQTLTRHLFIRGAENEQSTHKH